MRRVPYALTAALTALVLATPAQAAGCPLVADPAGDVGPAAIPLGVPAPSLDITGIDVASGPATVVVRMRVKALDLDPAALGWLSWSVSWEIDGNGYGAIAEQRPGHAGIRGSYGNGTNQPVVAVAVDAAAGTLTWTMPRSAFPELASPGATFGTIWGRAAETFTSLSDVTDRGPQTYADGTPGCVSAA